MGKSFDINVLRITLATSAALLASGCDSGPITAGQPTQVCVNGGGRRIADADCRPGRGAAAGGHAYYYRRGQTVPAVGEVAAGGSVQPVRGVAYVSAPEAVARGGFGGSAEAHGGFGGE